MAGTIADVSLSVATIITVGMTTLLELRGPAWRRVSSTESILRRFSEQTRCFMNEIKYKFCVCAFFFILFCFVLCCNYTCKLQGTLPYVRIEEAQISLRICPS